MDVGSDQDAGRKPDDTERIRDKKPTETDWQPPEIQDSVEIMGIGPIFAEGSPIVRRVFWAAVVLAGIAFAVVQIIQQISYYYSWPVTSSVKINGVTEVPFPRVGLCNMNRFRRDALPAGSNMSAYNFQNVFPSDMMSSDWRQNYIDMAHTRDESVLSCLFRGEKCAESDIVSVLSTDGVCFTFNVDFTKMTRHRGSQYGLYLRLNTQLNQYIAATDGYGFKIHIDGSPSPMMNGATLSPGQRTYVLLDHTEIHNLPHPWENCGEIQLRDFEVYSPTSCLTQCETDFVVKACNCQLLYMNRTGVNVCDPWTEVDCAKTALEDFWELGSPCNTTCPESCDANLYAYGMHYEEFSDSYLAQLTEDFGTDVEYWEKNLAEVSIYYRYLITESVQHEPVYDLFSLLCNLGGAMGLILGASIITVLEFIDYIILHIIWKHRNGKKNKKQVDGIKKV